MVIETRPGESPGGEPDPLLHKADSAIVAVEAMHADRSRRVVLTTQCAAARNSWVAGRHQARPHGYRCPIPSTTIRTMWRMSAALIVAVDSAVSMAWP